MTDGQAEDPASTVRPVDRARAIRLIAYQLHGDAEMWARTLDETLADDYGLGELGSLVAVLLVLSQDLAGALADVHGSERASQLLTSMLAALADEGTTDA